jgi:hypothetical protein
MTRAVLVLGSSIASRAAAQSGDGSLRGTVRDEQGAAMPGRQVDQPVIADRVAHYYCRRQQRLPRTYVFIVDEAGGGADMKPCNDPIRAASYMLDITTETKPMVVSSRSCVRRGACGRWPVHPRIHRRQEPTDDELNGEVSR